MCELRVYLKSYESLICQFWKIEKIGTLFLLQNAQFAQKNLGDEELFEHIHKEHPEIEHQFRTSNFINENNGLIRCHKCNYFFYLWISGPISRLHW